MKHGRFDNYMAGMSCIAGLDTDSVQLPEDMSNAKKALDALDSALTEAKAIVADQDTGTLAEMKAKITGVNLAAIRGEVSALGSAVDRMHTTFSKFDSTTPHSKIVEFVKACYDISDLSVLKESSNRNSLSLLVTEVSKETAKDVGVAAKSLTGSLWDSIPLPVKIGGGVVLAGIVVLKLR